MAIDAIEPIGAFSPVYSSAAAVALFERVAAQSSAARDARAAAAFN